MTVKHYFQMLKRLYFVFLTSIVPVLVIAFYYNGTVDIGFDKADTSLIGYGVILVSISSVLIALFLFKMIVSRVLITDDISKKLTTYQHSFIIRSAIIEGMALLNAIAYALISSELLLTLSGVLFGLLIFLKPSIKELKTNLKLTPLDLIKLKSNVNIEIVK